MAKIKYLFLSFFLLFSCDNKLNKDFFKSLLELPTADVKIICNNSRIFDSGKGYRWEVYQLSDDTYNEFVKKFKRGDTISAPNRNYFSKGDDILSWRKTPISSHDSEIINQKFASHNNKDTICFDQKQFFNLLEVKGNFYSAYYYHYTNDEIESFQWFVIDGKTREIYIQSDNP
jgi:hypothetical protein